MELQTVEIPRAGARQLAADYMREAKRTTDPVARNELEQIARAYRIAARDDVPLIALTPTVARGGTVIRTLVSRNGEHRTTYLLPALAAIRATARFAYTLGVQLDGSIELQDRMGRRDDFRSGRLQLGAGTFDLPAGYEQGRRIGQWASRAWSAMVPIVPPKHMPARGYGALDSRLILWEVEKWEWSHVPPAPGDPALLRHVGGDLYAVEAVWDLTPLEKLVLGEREHAVT